MYQLTLFPNTRYYQDGMDRITMIMPLEAFLRASYVLAIVIVLRFLYRGYTVRKRLRILKSQGIV